MRSRRREVWDAGRKVAEAGASEAGHHGGVCGPLWGGGPVTPRELLDPNDSKPQVMRRVVSRGEMNRLGSQIAFDDIG